MTKRREFANQLNISLSVSTPTDFLLNRNSLKASIGRRLIARMKNLLVSCVIDVDFALYDGDARTLSAVVD